MTQRYGYRLPTDLELEQADEIKRLRAENAKLRALLADMGIVPGAQVHVTMPVTQVKP